MIYNKLVRDRIPEIIRAKGGTPVTHIADEKEYWAKLKAKLQEESTEFFIDESPEEFADLVEVIHAIATFKGFDLEEIALLREQKNAARGAFTKRIILDEA